MHRSQQEHPTIPVCGVTPEGARHAPSHTAGKWQGSSCVWVICPSLLPHYSGWGTLPVIGFCCGRWFGHHTFPLQVMGLSTGHISMNPGSLVRFSLPQVHNGASKLSLKRSIAWPSCIMTLGPPSSGVPQSITLALLLVPHWIL